MTKHQTKEAVLLALALATIPLLLFPLVADLSPTQESTILAADIAIWVIFAADFFMGLALTNDRQGYLRTHWIDALVVLLPFLRPLRAARALRATVYGARALHGITRITEQSGFRPTVAIGIVLLVALALITASVESGSEGAIDDPSDALWWAFVTATTVGYGDAVPVTNTGRVLGVLTILIGIVVFSAVTAFVTAYLVNSSEKDEQLAELTRKLDRLEQLLLAFGDSRESRFDR